MHNGITMIARTLHTVGNKFSMSEFQVVNGCQTSHVLQDNRDLLTDAVKIPFRIVGTQDEGVIERIIRGTNRQTAARGDQFFAMKDFAKKLEEYFRTFPPGERLYYERRPHQYDDQDIPKRRIIAHINLVRAVGAMFLGEPHITTRTYRQLAAKVGNSFFVDSDNLEPYYTSALAAYQIDQMFSTGMLESRFKAARYQILLAMRLLLDGERLPPMNSKQMAARCEKMIAELWNDLSVTAVILKAASVIEEITNGEWDRDTIRTEPITKAIFEKFSLVYRETVAS